MGMYSWCCKGCGRELIEGEQVRLDGCRGTYDGYGRAGSFDHENYDPAAWHEYCYQRATTEEKISQTPSLHAPDQGFGCPHLLYLEKYNPEQETLFFVRIEGEPVELTPEKYHYPLLFIQPDNTLKDQSQYDKDKDTEQRALLDENEEIDLDEKERGWEAHDAKWNNLPRPIDTAQRFITLEAALQAAKSHTDKMPSYHCYIFGEQKRTGRDINGVVYEYRHYPQEHPDFNGIKYDYRALVKPSRQDSMETIIEHQSADKVVLIVKHCGQELARFEIKIEHPEHTEIIRAKAIIAGSEHGWGLSFRDGLDHAYEKQAEQVSR